jgi:hypothetical protein
MPQCVKIMETVVVRIIDTQHCRYIIYTQPRTTQYVFNQNPKLVCNSEGTDELPEDGTQLPKHVGAEKWNNKLIRVDTFVGYS